MEECEIAFPEPTNQSPFLRRSVLPFIPKGLRLVRIGEPLPVEFAVCRYGETYGRKNRSHAYLEVAGGAVVGRSPGGRRVRCWVLLEAGILAQTPEMPWMGSDGEASTTSTYPVPRRISQEKIHAGPGGIPESHREESHHGTKGEEKERERNNDPSREGRPGRVASKVVPPGKPFRGEGETPCRPGICVHDG